MNAEPFLPLDRVIHEKGRLGIMSALDLFGTYAGNRGDLAGWLSDATINTDRNLRLQFLAGMGLNLYQSAPIYKHMIQKSQYPEGFFTGTPETLAALRTRVETSIAQSR